MRRGHPRPHHRPEAEPPSVKEGLELGRGMVSWAQPFLPSHLYLRIPPQSLGSKCLDPRGWSH